MSRLAECIKRYWLLYFICLGVIIWGIFSWNTSSSFYERAFQKEALMISEEVEQCYVVSPDVYLEPGEYVAFLALSAGHGNMEFTVYDTYGVSRDNETGIVLGSFVLEAGSDTGSISFSVEQEMKHVHMQLTCSEEDAELISEIKVRSAEPIYHDSLVWILLALLVMAVFSVYTLWSGDKSDAEEKRKRLVIVGVLLLAAVIASLPIFYQTIYWGHDIWFHLSRIDGIAQGILNGQFPVRMHSNGNHGFGYASSVFYPEFFLYIPAVLRILGVSTYMAYKTLLVGMNLAAAVIAYYSFSKLLKSRKIGLLAAVLYILSLYRLINLYTRAAVGESLAMVFFPLLMWAVYEIVRGNEEKWLWTAAAYTCIIQSHVISVVLAAICILIYLLCNPGFFRKKKRLIAMGKAAGTTLLLNLWFFIPLLTHIRYPYFSTEMNYRMRDGSLYLNQLLAVTGFQPQALSMDLGEAAGEMPYAVGFGLLAGAALFLVWYLLENNEKGYFNKGSHSGVGLHRKIGIFCLWMSIGAVVMTLYPFPWDMVQGIPGLGKVLGIFQYPWRFLSVPALFLSVTAALGFSYFCIKAEAGRIMYAAGVAAAVFCALLYLNVFCEDSVYFLNREEMPMDKYDYMYTMADGNWGAFQQRNNQLEASRPGTVFTEFEHGYGHVSFRYVMDDRTEEDYFEVPLIFDPDYRIIYSTGSKDKEYDSGREIEGGWSSNSLLTVSPPENEGVITVDYRLPWYDRVGDLLSLVTLLGLLGGVVWHRKHCRVNKGQGTEKRNG